LPNLTKNVATRAAQRELLPKLTKILLSNLSREIAAKSQQNIAAKAAQRKKHGTIPGKTKAAKTADGTNAFSSYRVVKY
jgi:hypothetical protein